MKKTLPGLAIFGNITLLALFPRKISAGDFYRVFNRFRVLQGLPAGPAILTPFEIQGIVNPLN